MPKSIFRIVRVDYAHENTHHRNEKTPSGNIAAFFLKEITCVNLMKTSGRHWIKLYFTMMLQTWLTSMILSAFTAKYEEKRLEAGYYNYLKTIYGTDYKWKI